MAHTKYPTEATISNIPNQVPTMTAVHDHVEQMMFYSMPEFYELEPALVTKILLDEEEANKIFGRKLGASYYGAIKAEWVYNKDQKILPDGESWILPLDSRLRDYPVEGEVVILANYLGRTYYSKSLNFSNSVNSNFKLGISDISNWATDRTLIANTKFKQNTDIKNIAAKPGDFVINGRYGQSINLSSRNKKEPVIKIRAGQSRYDSGVSGIAHEDLNDDKSSIYLSATKRPYTVENENKNIRVYRKGGNQIILNSDSLIFNARSKNINIHANKKIVLQADEVFINAIKGGTIKMGNPLAPMIPTVNGEELLNLLKNVTNIIKKTLESLAGATNPASLVKAVKNLASLVTKEVPETIDAIKNKTFLNMTILQADPNFPIPELPIPTHLQRQVEKARERALKLREEVGAKSDEVVQGSVSSVQEKLNKQGGG